MSFRFMGGSPYRVASPAPFGDWSLVFIYSQDNFIEALGIAKISQMVLFTVIFKLPAPIKDNCREHDSLNAHSYLC